jgi:hypothetical protein
MTEADISHHSLRLLNDTFQPQIESVDFMSASRLPVGQTRYALTNLTSVGLVLEPIVVAVISIVSLFERADISHPLLFQCQL